MKHHQIVWVPGKVQSLTDSCLLVLFVSLSEIRAELNK